MYLNQLGLKAKTDKMSMVRKKLNGKCDDDDDDNFVNDNNVANDKKTENRPESRTNPEMKLPAKKKIFLRENLKTGNGDYQESIYDCVPKPRSCLRDDQVRKRINKQDVAMHIHKNCFFLMLEQGKII